MMKFIKKKIPNKRSNVGNSIVLLRRRKNYFNLTYLSVIVKKNSIRIYINVYSN